MHWNDVGVLLSNAVTNLNAEPNKLPSNKADEEVSENFFPFEAKLQGINPENEKGMMLKQIKIQIRYLLHKEPD